jgi:hypothetical protein
LKGEFRGVTLNNFFFIKIFAYSMEGIRPLRDIIFDFDLDNDPNKREEKKVESPPVELKSEKEEKVVENDSPLIAWVEEKILHTEFRSNGKEEEDDYSSNYSYSSSEEKKEVPAFLHKLSSDDQQIPDFGTVLKRSADYSPHSSIDDFQEEYDPHEFYNHAIKELDHARNQLEDLKVTPAATSLITQRTSAESRKHDEPHNKKDEDEAAQHRIHVVTEIDATLEATAKIVDFVGTIKKSFFRLFSHKKALSPI